MCRHNTRSSSDVCTKSKAMLLAGCWWLALRFEMNLPLVPFCCLELTGPACGRAGSIFSVYAQKKIDRKKDESVRITFALMNMSDG